MNLLADLPADCGREVFDELLRGGAEIEYPDGRRVVLAAGDCLVRHERVS